MLADDDSGSDDDPYGFDEADEPAPTPPSATAAAAGSLPQKVEQQAAYICQLEETNLKLQERIYLLERDLQAAQSHRGGDGSAAGASGRSRPAEGTDGSDGERLVRGEAEREDDDEDARSMAADGEGDGSP